MVPAPARSASTSRSPKTRRYPRASTSALSSERSLPSQEASCSHDTRSRAPSLGEIDIAYAVWGALAQEIRRSPGLTLKATVVPTPFWVYFAEQWDPKSPWHDRRVRLAANHALDRQAINEAENLGFAKITTSIIPASFDFFWAPPAYAHDPARAKKLLAEAGYPNGFEFEWTTSQNESWGLPIVEAVIPMLARVGIKVKVKQVEVSVLVDLRSKNITGRDAESALGKVGITVNKNAVPEDPQKPTVTSGIRIGTPAMTTRGFKEAEAEQVAGLIADVLDEPNSESRLKQVAAEVRRLCDRYPVYRR